MSDVVIRFKPFFRMTMLAGVKTCTSRTKALGKPGDRFRAFGATFEILSVEERRLYEVKWRWKADGCASEEHFVEVWNLIHPVVGYDDYQIVQLHTFKKVTP